jgi:type II secretory pathway pseudopilin PulG
MKKLVNKYRMDSGFTLVEVLVYLGLFTILIGGAVAAAYNVIESSGRNQTMAILQQESTFITGKINWALSGIEGINAPLVGTPSSQLLVTKIDPSIGPLDIRPDLNNINDLQISRNNASSQILNSSNVQLTNLIFNHQTSGSGAEWVTASFTLSARTPNGQMISQNFETTKYVRR